MPFAPDALQRHNIETKISQALEKVKQLLGAEKSPQIAGDVHHDYEDKYLLVERATNMAAAAELNCFGMLGLTPQQLSTLKQWTSGGQEVSLRFKAKEQCNFLREETREEEAPRKHVEEVSVGGVLRSAITSKVVTKITEYFWNFETNYVLEAFKGVGAEAADRMVIWSRQGQVELKTSAKSPAPHPEVRSPAVNKEVNISWLLRTLSDPATPTFSIDRTVKSCKTPRRNQDFDKAYAHFMALSNWTMYVADYINHLRTVQPRKIDDSALSLEHIFVPITPIMFKEGIGEINDTSAKAPLMSALGGNSAESLVMSASAGNVLLAEQMRSLKEQHQNILTCFPGDAGILTSAEACMSLTLTHLNSVAHQWVQAADYVESMLRKQLVAAIGKEVSPSEFGSYMRFHYRKLFLDAYQPSQFSFAVRRTEQHGPEGTVSIEEESYGETGASMHTPIVTLKNHGSTPTAISFPLSASTTVSFTGPVHLHGFLRHSFSGQSGSGLFLKSRARQFSSMLVLVGRVTSATSFDPTYAAIIQNKDELTIPLEMSVIPTPKEFKDAIASLSPEQQQFAKAFRAMQLESTLFGVLVVQIKPQLEKLLNLPDDSLTKEIKLTQDLMELFLKYQIPSDLLSFSEPEGATETTSAPARLQTVKGHVKAMLDMIQKEKEEEIEERKKEAQFAQPLIDIDRFGSDDLMCFGAAGAAPLSMVSDSCEAMEVDFGMHRAAEKKSKGRAMTRARAAPAMASCPVPPPPAAAFSSTPTPAATPATPAATPAPAESTPPEPQHQPNKVETMGPGASASVGVSRDYTQVPQEMDEQFEKMDPDSSLRPTIINVGKQWKKRSQKALLAQPTEVNLTADEQKSEKDAAFDLLDAITKSGALPLSHATLHIVIAATHCFDKTVLETVVQENVNPIEKVERSTLIMASTVHQQPTAAIINQSSFSRVSAASPQLFLKDAD